MPVSELVIATPYYMLMNIKTPFGPSVADPIRGAEYSAIFGFSDKASYDSFFCESPVSLTPYPLVKGYLRNQLGAPGHDDADEGGTKLVILDAPGPREPYVHAATMRKVLQAQETGTTHITPTHYLTFNPEANVYRLEETPE